MAKYFETLKGKDVKRRRFGDGTVATCVHDMCCAAFIEILFSDNNRQYTMKALQNDDRCGLYYDGEMVGYVSITPKKTITVSRSVHGFVFKTIIKIAHVNCFGSKLPYDC